jgi:hypothetical protein
MQICLKETEAHACPSFTKNAKEVPIIKTIATEKKGIHELYKR